MWQYIVKIFDRTRHSIKQFHLQILLGKKYTNSLYSFEIPVSQLIFCYFYTVVIISIDNLMFLILKIYLFILLSMILKNDNTPSFLVYYLITGKLSLSLSTLHFYHLSSEKYQTFEWF